MRLRILPPKLGARSASLILGLVAACVVLGWKAVDAANRQSAVVARVSRTHGTPQYGFPIRVPRWCVDWFGPDLFARVTSVSYFEWGAHPPHEPANFRNYTALCELPHLEEIEVFDSAFPIEILESIPTLQRLTIVQNGLRDGDMNVILKLQCLKSLSLQLNDITDSGAQSLSRLQNLTEMDLSGNCVSAETISELELSLPRCRIKNEWSRADSLNSPRTSATEHIKD